MAPTITTQPYETMADQSRSSLTLTPIRSRSVSFSPVSLSSPVTPSTPHHAGAIPIRWSKELEDRLRHAEKNMEEHQKRWSEGQEEYWEEVEALQELKRRFERFIRRRSKDHSREGKRFLRAASVGSSDVETTPAPAQAFNNSRAAKKPTAGLLRRFSAVVANSVHNDASLAPHSRRPTESTIKVRCPAMASRRPSMPVSPTGLDGAGPALSSTTPVRARAPRVARRSLTA